MIYTWFLIIFSMKILSHADAAKILGIFPINSKSHFSISQPIIKALTARGHQITVVSSFKSQSPQNYTEIPMSAALMTYLDSMTVEQTKHHIGVMNTMRIIDTAEEPTCVDILHLEFIQRLIHSKTKKFDLMIVEMHFTLCYTLLAQKLDVPIVVILPPGIDYGVDYFTAHPFNPSYVPMLYRPYTTNMNFFQRLLNTFDYAVVHYHMAFVFNRNLKKIAKDVFNMESIPDESTLCKRIAIVFCNNHFSFLNRPTNPNRIEVAGIHITEAKKLPEDIQNFIDGSPHGVIYFSFGSTIKASSIDPRTINMMMEVFSKLPQRVLWRVNELNITDIVPPNVKLGKWFPQRDILEHKNVIAFISHCGLFSTLEAIHTATPVIAIPFMFDQFQDAEILSERGAGIYLDYDTMDKNTFAKALRDIVTNTKYSENMLKLSSVFRDRPLSQLDEAVYWTEYVLKHDGADHLKTKAVDMPFYQYFLFDVITFVTVIVASFLYLCKFIFKTIFSFFCKNEIKKKIS